MRCMTATLSNPMPSLPEDPSFFSDNALVLVATFGPSNHFFGQKKVPCVKVWHFWVRGNMPLDDTPKTCFLYKGLPWHETYCIVLHRIAAWSWKAPRQGYVATPKLRIFCGSQSAKFMCSLYACGMPREKRNTEVICASVRVCECASGWIQQA